jgi:TolA-binding protein
VRVWAVAVGCVLLGAVTSALAGVAVTRLYHRALTPATEPAAGAPPARHARRKTSLATGRIALPSPSEDSPTTDEDGAVPAWAEPRSRPRAETPAAPRARERQLAAASQPVVPPPLAPAEMPANAPAQTATAPASEPADLADVLRVLRGQKDAAAALARLDEHDRKYPAGVLARESALARVEALLALGRDGAALELLDRLELEGNGLDRRALLARAELRAAAGRCLDASGDLARAPAGAGPDAPDGLAARALYGDGICHLRAGDLSGARAAFESYLRDFPDGPRRDDVERALLRIGR